MTSYRVAAIPHHITQEVRASLKSPQYGHPAHVEIASGYGPCRSCLQTFRTGAEQRILFTYNPFEGLSDYPSPGPIFIHKEECAEYASSGFPGKLRELPLMFEAFGHDRELITKERIGNDKVDAAIMRLLANPAAQYLHVRNAEAGCYIARIERC